MHRIIKEQYIVSLIVKEEIGTIGENEKTVLADWLSESEGNREAYEQLKQMDIAGELERYRRLNTEKGWEKYRVAYPSLRKRKNWGWIKVAAAAMIVLAIGITGIISNRRSAGIGDPAGNPGTSKAVLVLSDGTMKNLAPQSEEEIFRAGELTIRNDGTSLRYERSEDKVEKKEEGEIRYNELRVPAGGEYQLLLDDGTKVWLNSQTVLRYPEIFQKEMRQVELEGEAYFEVARDEKRPFRVEIRNEVKVEVLGTSFNVRAYRDEESVETVLEKGAVRMWQKAENRTLLPGMRAICKNGVIELDTVQTELYTAWHVGQYVFREETVENILRRLSRWYNVKIFYAHEEAKHMIFSGNVKKYETIRNLLDAMELAGGVQFEIRGNTVVVNGTGKN